MTYINYNYAANVAANAIGRNDRALDSAMNRISTGTRVGNGDNELGLYAQYVEVKSDAIEARQGVESVNRGLAQMKLIESQVTILGEIMIRMHELATAASSNSLQAHDRYALDGEFQALGAEATRITTETKWNGTAVLDGTDITIDTLVGTGVVVVLDDFQFDANAALGTGIASGAVIAATTDSAGGTTSDIDTSLDVAAVASGAPATSKTTITTQATAELALAILDVRVPYYAGAIQRLGGQVRQVEFAADSMAAMAVGFEAATAGIRDADYAVETAKLASAQVISQAATAMVAQANARSTSVLALLQ